MEIGKDYIGVSVGALIFNEKREVFLSKRSMKTRNERGSWEAPGGKVEFGEKRADAIRREMKEEFGVDLEVQELLCTNDEILEKDKQHWVATTYIAKIKGSEQPKIMEPDKCDAIGWFELDSLPKPLSYITTLDLAEYRKRYLESRMGSP